MTLPALTPTNEAQLPRSYEAARQALAACSRIDECKDWSNRAAALASYAKQAGDDELMKRSLRIKDRATRRCGELLKQFDSPGARTDKPTEGAHPRSASEAAEQAGISPHQHKTAVRVANIPAEQFEELVESDKPPTVTALANIGKRSQQPSPEDADMAETMELDKPTTRRRGTKTFVPDGQDIVELCKRGLALEEQGYPINEISAEIGLAINNYRLSRQIAFLADRPELSIKDKALIAKAINILKTTHEYMKAWEVAKPVAQRMWGTTHTGERLLSIAGRRMERFKAAFGIVMQSCLTADEVQLPYLSKQQSEECAKEIIRARKALAVFATRIQEIHK